ncbi:MAG: hypothetical protein PHS60_05880 [Zavarzinia sp.]|nr:hypothetical protein [Zavarzinia sp.]
MAPERVHWRRFATRLMAATRALGRWVVPRGWPLVAIVLGLVYVTLSLGLPSPETVSVIEARSESAEFTVLNPDLATLRLGAMRLVDPTSDADPACVDGLLVPALGAVARYQLAEDGILIAVTTAAAAAGRIERQGQPDLTLPAEAWLIPAPDCPGRPPRRLPLVGPLVLGEELRPDTFEGSSHPLIDGRLAVYGRAIAVDLGIYRSAPTLYPVSEITLPGGSRLFAPPVDGQSVPWHGFVSPGACGEAGCDPFTVQASTMAKTLHLVRPGTGVQPEVISISAFAQLFSDPSIVYLWILVGVLSLLIQTLANAGDLFAKLRPPPP